MPLADWTITKSERQKEVTEKGFITGNVITLVTYRHNASGEEFTQEFKGNVLTDAYIAEKTAVRALALDDSVKTLEALTAGVVTPVAPPVPTQEQLDRQAFQLALQNVARIDQRMKFGIQVEQKEIDEAKAAAQALYQPGF